MFDDADLEAVVAGMRMVGFYNAGQDCTAACRIYAGTRKSTIELVADLGSAVGSLKFGAPDDRTTPRSGPLISAAPA